MGQIKAGDRSDLACEPWFPTLALNELPLQSPDEAFILTEKGLMAVKLPKLTHQRDKILGIR